MKKIIKINLECIGLEIFFSILSMFFYISVIPPKLFSFITALLFIGAVHTTFWTLGDKERKQFAIANNHLQTGDTPKIQHWFRGLIVALPFLIINIIFLLLTCLINNDIMVTIQSFLHFTFSGFIPVPTDSLGFDYFFPRLIVCVVMYLPSSFSYVLGKHNISITEKLVFKNKKDTKQ
ncbi:MAG: hypothetical protein E7395_05645 [Ruminococcaceae bacterium]|nr:hypothetical protein [Oscillospiraceae bacterium]